MSPLRSCSRALPMMLAATLFATSVAPAFAAPSAGAVAADRARVEASLQRLEAARAKAEHIDAQLQRQSAAMDKIVAEQRSTRRHLTLRARHMYRAGDVSLVSVLLGAATYEEFSARWHLLTLMNRHDARALRRLQVSRAKARAASEDLLALQEQSARTADLIARELASARKDLAANQAALAAYRSRLEARPAQPMVAAKPVVAPKSAPRLTGRGAWKVGVASHYGRNFTGRGASGEQIGPYSMMCAHKTLPFGTLVEFEYGGKRAVARVADRGPFTPGRDFDLGPGVVRVLNFEGVHEVRYRIIER